MLKPTKLKPEEGTEVTELAPECEQSNDGTEGAKLKPESKRPPPSPQTTVNPTMDMIESTLEPTELNPEGNEGTEPECESAKLEPEPQHAGGTELEPKPECAEGMSSFHGDSLLLPLPSNQRKGIFCRKKAIGRLKDGRKVKQGTCDYQGARESHGCSFCSTTAGDICCYV